MVSPEAIAGTGTGERRVRQRARSVLVTGVPRSGTTWLARELAVLGGAALPGREPMNPRRRQFALGGSVTGWTAMGHPTRRQERLLQRCYRGWEPRTFSRYGIRQWAGLLPGVPVVVKDPFALLSVPAVVRSTGAVPVIVYRHPGAVLASYRRMGWAPDTAELRRLGLSRGRPLQPGDGAASMAEFWSALHVQVLEWLGDVPDALLVSHQEVTLGGDAALLELVRRCGLNPRPRVSRALPSGSPAEAGGTPERGRLHGFDRAAAEVTQGWRSHLSETELVTLETLTATTWRELETRRLPLPARAWPRGKTT